MKSLSLLSLIQLVLMLCILAVGTVSNILVLIALTKRNNRRKTSNILLFNLAVCDTLVSAVCISLDVTELVHQSWVFGRLLCSVIYPFQTSMPIVSSYTMMFMLFERNLLFSKRIRSTLQAKTIKVFACATWAIALIVVFPYALHLYVDDSGKHCACVEAWSKDIHRKTYTVALSLIEYVIPMFVIVMLMVKIYGYLQRERQVVKNGTLGLERRVSVRRIKRNKRLTIIFLVMVSAYGILKLPNNAFWQWVEFGNGGTSKHFAKIRLFVGLCAYSTCAANPFILLSMSSEMRKDVRRLIACVKINLSAEGKQRDSTGSELTTMPSKTSSQKHCTRNKRNANQYRNYSSDTVSKSRRSSV